MDMATHEQTQPDDGQVVNIGTRKSQLAIAQVDMIIAQLEAAAPGPQYRMQVVSTMADKNQAKAYQEFNSKSIWTEELEQLLADKKLDVIVHCLKDMPTLLPQSCMLSTICKREDPRDVVVMRTGSPFQSLQQLPPDSTVGTSSVRRKAQIAHFYPHLKCADIRGNLNTRLRKLDDINTQYDCLVLAAAGLKRIHLEHRITQFLDSGNGILYAPGQGALGLEIRKGDKEMLALLDTLGHVPTTLACTAEKSLLKRLEGGCSAPIGVATNWEDGCDQLLSFRAQVLSIDGKEIVESSIRALVRTLEEAEAVGYELAKRMIDLGADKILAGVGTAL